MATDPDDGDDENEWRFSLEDIEEREDSEGTGSEEAGSDATESSGLASGDAANGDRSDVTDRAGDTRDGDADEEGGGLSAGVAGRMEFDEELEAQEINVENALFVVFGVLLAIAFFVGFLNLL
jgi:hypothetical protein